MKPSFPCKRTERVKAETCLYRLERLRRTDLPELDPEWIARGIAQARTVFQRTAARIKLTLRGM